MNAPKKCILTIDLDNPARENWKTIIPEADEAMQTAGMVGDYIIVNTSKTPKPRSNCLTSQANLSAKSIFPGLEVPGVWWPAET